MREFEAGFQKLQSELQNEEARLAVMTMDNIRGRGLVKGEQKGDTYKDIKQNVTGIINYKKPLKSKRGKTRLTGNRKKKAREFFKNLKPGEFNRPRKIFVKNRIAVRKSNLFEIFDHKTNFSKGFKGLVQKRKNAKITIEKFRDGKKSVRFEFFGSDGRMLRLKSFGNKRKQVVTTAEGKQLKGRKGKRDVVRNNIRRVFVGLHNKALKKYVDSDYAKDFKKIK